MKPGPGANATKRATRCLVAARPVLKTAAFTIGLFAMLAATGCGSSGSDDASSGDDQPAASNTQPTSPQAATTNADSDARQIAGTTIRFSSNTTSVDVTIGEDNPTVRDFLSMLPLALTVEEFAGREKVSYLPRELRHRGSHGSDPESGDLIYFVPWGNLGFYYNAEGIGYSDETIHLGTYDAPLDQLERLEGEVTVEVID
jgi:hypothetical protein